MESYLAFIANDEVSGLAESFNHVQGIGFRDFSSEIPNQKTDEGFFGPWACGPPLLLQCCRSDGAWEDKIGHSLLQ